MDKKSYTIVPNLSSNSDIKTTTATTATTTANSFVLSSSTSTTTTPSLQTLQPVPISQSVNSYSDHHQRSNITITQPIFSKLSSEAIKQEQRQEHSVGEKYLSTKNKSSINQLKPNNIRNTPGLASVHLNPGETINGLSAISMANINGHLMSTLNVSHLPNGTGNYFVSVKLKAISYLLGSLGKERNSENSTYRTFISSKIIGSSIKLGFPSDLTSSYKLPASSNSDLPSPSTSSNSSNPSSSHNHHPHLHHQGKRHGEGNDPTRKREVRLQKNRDAARECRRKKKEYIKCLEERVTTLENQNKALIEELRQLKELYYQRDDTNTSTNTKALSTTR